MVKSLIALPQYKTSVIAAALGLSGDQIKKGCAKQEATANTGNYFLAIEVMALSSKASNLSSYLTVRARKFGKSMILQVLNSRKAYVPVFWVT